VHEEAIVHPQVQLEAVELDPLAGDVAPVDPLRGQLAPGSPDALAGRKGEGIQSVSLGLVQVLPETGEEGEEGQEVRL
jgi:hypothetical protein